MSAEIHPTAVVDPNASLGDGVKVGPYAVIEAGATVGDRCEIQAHAVVAGGTVLGPDNRVGCGAVLGAEPQDLAFRGMPSGVAIGAGNRIREHVTIHRSSQPAGMTRVGDGNFLMVGAHLGHDVALGSRAILANHVLLGGHVTVEDGVFLGGATIVHQHVRIGRLAITQGGTRLSKDVAPYFMASDLNRASGINRIGLRRAGLSYETRRAIQAAYEILCRSGLNVSQALEDLERKFHHEEIAHLVAFVRASKRGICLEKRRPAKADESGDEA